MDNASCLRSGVLIKQTVARLLERGIKEGIESHDNKRLASRTRGWKRYERVALYI
jgi:hypothetical protein